LNMLISLDSITGFGVDNGAMSGELHDFLIEKAPWRAGLAEIHFSPHHLEHRRVGISPSLFENIDALKGSIELRKDIKLEDMPDVPWPKVISHRMGERTVNSFRWSAYPHGETNKLELVSEEDIEKQENIFRSFNEMKKYTVEDINKEKTGILYDFLCDDKSWEIKYLVLEHHRISARKHPVPVHYIEKISWENEAVSINNEKETVLNSPSMRSGVFFEAVSDVEEYYRDKE